MNKPKIYLSGPIKGESFSAAASWRDHVVDMKGFRFHFLNPMGGVKSMLKGEEELDNHDYPDHPFLWEKTIYTRDRHDVLNRADGLFVFLSNSKRVSIGTMFEIAWASTRGIPIIVVRDNDILHDHPFITHAASTVVDNMVDGLLLLEHYFCTGVVS